MDMKFDDIIPGKASRSGEEQDESPIDGSPFRIDELA